MIAGEAHWKLVYGTAPGHTRVSRRERHLQVGSCATHAGVSSGLTIQVIFHEPGKHCHLLPVCDTGRDRRIDAN